MNVWFAANIPEDSKGGISRSMRGLSDGLRQRGHRVRIVVNSPGTRNENLMVFAFMLGLRFLVHLKNPPDWIIARSSDGFFCGLLVKAFRLKTRVVLHNHGWEENVLELEKRLPRSFISFPTTWKSRLLRFPLLRATLSLSDYCVCGTLSEIRWLNTKYPRHRPKVRYVPNGVQCNHDFTWVDKDNAPLHFLSVGGDTWKKNLGHVVAVFRELRERAPASRLFLVGAGSNAMKGIVLTEDDRGAITIVAEEEPSRMERWYATCPFLISCSRYEGGHSFALLEALSYGCVVFASAIPSTMEVIQNEVNGILIGGIEPRKDAQAIRHALENNDITNRIRHNAQRTAQRNRWNRQISRLEKILCPT